MVKTYTEPYRGEASCGPVAHAAVAMGENARFDALLEYLETHETELRNLNLADLKQCLRTGVKSTFACKFESKERGRRGTMWHSHFL